jgi:ankyrin repeat protein
MNKAVYKMGIVSYLFGSMILTGMEQPLNQPLNTMHQTFVFFIASYCFPPTKNIMMQVCKDLYVHIKKNRLLIIRSNPSTAGLRDKAKALFASIKRADIDTLRVLLNTKIEFDQNILGMTPLDYALEQKNKNIELLLCEHGIGKLKPNVHLLHQAVYENNKDEVIKLVQELQISPNINLTNDITPLLIACHEGHTEMVELLIGFQAHLNNADNTGETPLYKAVSNQYPLIVELLLNEKAEVNQANNDQWTPLHKAAYDGNSMIVSLLLEADASLDSLTYLGETPLQLAQKQGHEHIVKLLDAPISPRKRLSKSLKRKLSKPTEKLKKFF